MQQADKQELLRRYADHARRFEEAATRRAGTTRSIDVPLSRDDTPQEPTEREQQVLRLIADGLVNREIGHRLYLSEETVKSHVRHLLAKLQARSRAHAVAIGFRRQLLD